MSLLLLLGGAKAEPTTGTTVTLIREHPPSRVAVLAKAEDGTKLGRWAEDESSVENVLANATKSGDMPGGHGDSGGSLARDPKRSYPDLASFSKVEWQGAGGEVLWSGTLRQQPQSDGDRISIEPKAVGDKQFLEDDDTIVGPGFINIDQSRWVGASAQRKIDLGPGFDQSSSPGIDTDPGGSPRVSITSTGALKGPVWMAMFDAGPEIRIAQMSGLVEPVNLNASLDPAISAGMYSADDDRFSNFVSLGSVAAGGGFSDVVNSKRVVAFQGSYTGAGGEDGVEYGYRLGNLMVLGANGLLLKGGAWPNFGFFAEQMIPFIAAQAGLTTRDELLEDDEFIIPHAWFDAPGTPMAKLVEVTKYGLLDWFVFNDRILQYRKPGTFGRRWRLNPGSGAPKNSGPDAERIIDGLKVQWQDVDGTTKTLGPAGSGADYLDNRLLITDERNAAIAAGRPKRKLLALNGVCTAEMALKVGMRFLEEAQNLAQSGEATIAGYCQDEYGIWWPAAYVQPGDWAADPGTQNYRKITHVDYAHDSKTASVTLGAPPETYAALEARMNAKLIEKGLG